MRLDLDGPPHNNPADPPADQAWRLAAWAGQTISCPHLHIYVEGYGSKWAIPAPVDRYPNVEDLLSALFAFMRHCNITNPPAIDMVLF